MAVTLNGTTGLVFNDGSAQDTAATGFGFKNRIINGAMVIDQRNAGAAVTVNSTASFYPVDRFYGYGQSSDGVFTLQQSTTAPVGFLNSIVATVTTADASVGAAQLYNLSYRVEGNDIADLGWGTADAKTVTLSFWVRSSLTGTFGGALSNSAYNYSYPFTYTISSADTWEKKTITIAGATSGTWVTNNGIGVRVYWSIGTGSNNLGTAGSWTGSGKVGVTGATDVISTSGATWYITGVQFEKGSTATSFDYRPYGTELALAQRYCQKIIADATAVYARFGVGVVISTNLSDLVIYLKTSMRISPSVTTTGTASNYGIYSGTGVTTVTGGLISNSSGTNPELINMQPTVASGLVVGQGAILLANNTATAYLLFTAEL
jgi:hypothetical protein